MPVTTTIPFHPQSCPSNKPSGMKRIIFVIISGQYVFHSLYDQNTSRWYFASELAVLNSSVSPRMKKMYGIRILIVQFLVSKRSIGTEANNVRKNHSGISFRVRNVSISPPPTHATAPHSHRDQHKKQTAPQSNRS